MKTRVWCALSLVAALGGAACRDSGRPSDGASGKFQVVAAFYPIAYTAEQIGGPAVSVYDLTPAGAEPHDIELRPSDLSRIRDADLILYLGGGFQPALQDAIADRKAKAVDLLDGLPLRPGDGVELAFDPHVWLDPLLMQKIADRIEQELIKRIPAERSGIEERAEVFRVRLKALDQEYRGKLANCARRDIVTSHAAFGYLAAQYGLTQIAISGLAPEAEPSPSRLAEVARIAKERGATTIFFETLVSPRVAAAVARNVGAVTAVLNPIEGLTNVERKAGDDYFTLMRKNLAAIARALGCR